MSFAELLPSVFEKYQRDRDIVTIWTEITDLWLKMALDVKLAFCIIGDKSPSSKNIPATLLAVFVDDMYRLTNKPFSVLKDLLARKEFMACTKFITKLWLTRPFALALQDASYIAQVTAELADTFPEFDPSTVSGIGLVFAKVKQAFPTEDVEVQELIREECKRVVHQEIQRKKSYLCVICNERVTRFVDIDLECGHHIHKKCFRTWTLQDKVTCATCHTPFDSIHYRSNLVNVLSSSVLN